MIKEHERQTERRLSRRRPPQVDRRRRRCRLSWALASAKPARRSSRLGAETGRLHVLDWAGYGYDGGQAMFAAYAKKYPKYKPEFT